MDKKIPEGPSEAGGKTGPDKDISKQKKGKNITRALALAAAVCALIGAASWFHMQSSGRSYGTVKETVSQDSPVSTQEKAAAAATESDSSAAAATASAQTAAPVKPVPAEEVPIDFETLWKTCPDAYSWIRIPETQVDYPVCQVVEGDQSFYLNHRADKVAESAGAIFSENYNTRDYTDPVTVLYGHDMSNGTMFQNLHFYEDRAFFDENREVLIYLPNKVLHYRIFAAYNTNDDHLLVNNDCFRDEVDYYKYLQWIVANAPLTGFADRNIELTKESRILTLSTCNAYDDQRYLVQAVLMNPEVIMSENVVPD